MQPGGFKGSSCQESSVGISGQVGITQWQRNIIYGIGAGGRSQPQSFLINSGDKGSLASRQGCFIDTVLNPNHIIINGLFSGAYNLNLRAVIRYDIKVCFIAS